MEPIIELLKNNHLMISVEGHTDNVPINTAQFPSNWELSAARAIGYADSLPLQSNDTKAGQAANRRVNLVLSEPE